METGSDQKQEEVPSSLESNDEQRSSSLGHGDVSAGGFTLSREEFMSRRSDQEQQLPEAGRRASGVGPRASGVGPRASGLGPRASAQCFLTNTEPLLVFLQR